MDDSRQKAAPSSRATLEFELHNRHHTKPPQAASQRMGPLLGEVHMTRRAKLRAAVSLHAQHIPLDLFTADDLMNWMLSPELWPLSMDFAGTGHGSNFTNRQAVATILAEMARKGELVAMGKVPNYRRLLGYHPSGLVKRGRTVCYALPATAARIAAD